MEGTAMTLATYLETLGQVITAVFEWVVQVMSIITSNPILLVPFGVIACYTAVRLLKKIF
ncbi:MAG: hypothetical protein IJO43_02215 [Bacilli bacterium]|nr:hypothetical protein [Bacilli bacterium]